MGLGGIWKRDWMASPVLFQQPSSMQFIQQLIFHLVYWISHLSLSSSCQPSSMQFIQPIIFPLPSSFCHLLHSASHLSFNSFGKQSNILFIQIVNVHPVDWMKEILCKSPSKKITEKYTYSDKVWWYTPEHRHVCSDGVSYFDILTLYQPGPTLILLHCTIVHGI